MATASARRAVSTLALGALALAVLAAGCGGGKGAATQAATTNAGAPPVARTEHLAKHAYVVRMQRLGRRLGRTIQKVYPIETGTAGSQTSRDAVARLVVAHHAVQEVLTSLQAIAPPARVRGDHRRLETGVRGMATEMQEVIDALRSGDLAATIVPAALPSLRLVTEATDGMEHKGYDVLGPAPSPKS